MKSFVHTPEMEMLEIVMEHHANQKQKLEMMCLTLRSDDYLKEELIEVEKAVKEVRIRISDYKLVIECLSVDDIKSALEMACVSGMSTTEFMRLHELVAEEKACNM